MPIFNPGLPATSESPSQYLDMPQVLDMLSRLLDTCVRDHTWYREDIDPNWHPTRLINVEGKVPRLVVTAEVEMALERKPSYLALSHIWGESTFTRLVSANSEQLKCGIPSSGLSQTFRDAIGLTQRVGVRYLWIDSLCVQRDSFDDWRTESSMMGSVYRNNLFTISA